MDFIPVIPTKKDRMSKNAKTKTLKRFGEDFDSGKPVWSRHRTCWSSSAQHSPSPLSGDPSMSPNKTATGGELHFRSPGTTSQFPCVSSLIWHMWWETCHLKQNLVARKRLWLTTRLQRCKLTLHRFNQAAWMIRTTGTLCGTFFVVTRFTNFWFATKKCVYRSPWA